VFLVHLLEFLCAQAPKGSFDSRVINWLYPLGNQAGAFFVIITGCFLYRALLSKPVSYPAFLRRRFARIYSVFSVVLAIYVVLSILFPGESKQPQNPLQASKYILENLLLLPGVFAIPPIITVSWTLSYVALYCILLPPIVEWTGMREWRSSQRVLFFLVAAVAWAAGAQLTGAYVARIALLPIGALAQEALAWRKANPERLAWLESAAIGVGGLALGLKYWFVHVEQLSIFSVGQGLHQLSLTAIILLCATFALFSDRSYFKRPLCSAGPKYLGNMSFSYYLTHGLTVKFLTLFAPAVAILVRSAAGFWLLVPITFALSLIPAAALYLAVEKRTGERMKTARDLESVPRSMPAAA
jgi:peptidoglycan/LPS O-acetylase OafA/YrhL